MSVRPGRGGRRQPAIKSSMYFAGTPTASASSSGERLISRRRWRTSSPTVAGRFDGGDDVIYRASSGRLGAATRSLVPEGDAPAREVVRGHGESDSVAGEHADAEASHLARNCGEHVVAVGQMDTKRAVGQHVLYDAVDLYRLFLGHHSPSSVAGTNARLSRITSRATRPAPPGTTSNSTGSPT